ncbi:hypothetical protein [Sphingobacterium sp. LRF_L2]|uniref:hypothetical protein n=1 Tax=Sphingobacterium sp. LRF_L2 TaxID=3369421 RepID=UPI003F5DD415
MNTSTNQAKVNMYKKKSENVKLWLKRAGAGAFLFFLLKGIVWLIVFALAAKSCS